MKTLIVTYLVLLPIFLLGQKWHNTYGTPYYDEYGIDVAESYDRGYLLNIGVGDEEPSMIIKTDINGNILWQKHFTDEDQYDLVISTILQDEEGNIYFLGWRLIQFESGWPIIIKLDSCGNQVWCRQFIDDEYLWGWFQDAILLEDGNILGMTHMESQDQIEMVFLYNISPDGDLEWKKSYASKNNYPLIHSRSPMKLQEVNDLYIISGYCYYAYPNNPPHGYLRPLYIGIDMEFEEQFVLPFGMADSIPGKAFSTIAINDTLFMGSGGHWLISDKDVCDNSYLMFFDRYGAEVGYNEIPNGAIGPDILSNSMRQVERINDTLFFATGFWGDQYQGNDNGSYVIDSSGHIYHIDSYPNCSDAPQLVKTFDNKFVQIFSERSGDWDARLIKLNDTLGSDTIYHGSYTYDSLCPYGIQSDTIDLTGCLITTNIGESIEVTNSGDHQRSFEIFPNPADDFLRCRFYKSNVPKYLYTYDIMGRVIDRIRIPSGSNELTINISDYIEGLYMASLVQGSAIVCRKFIITR